MEFDLKWVHMARYELILELEGALWLRIISKPLLTQKRADNTSDVHRARHYQNPLYQQKARAHIKNAQKFTRCGPLLPWKSSVEGRSLDIS